MKNTRRGFFATIAALFVAPKLPPITVTCSGSRPVLHAGLNFGKPCSYRDSGLTSFPVANYSMHVRIKLDDLATDKLKRLRDASIELARRQREREERLVWSVLNDESLTAGHPRPALQDHQGRRAKP